MTTPALKQAAQQAVQEVVDITIDDDDALEFLRDMLVQSDGDLTPIRLFIGDGHSGRGLYVASADYPEEGAIKIADIAALQPAQPEQEPVVIPDDVRKVAQSMQKDGYRGPLAWASKVIDFVADYATPPAAAQRKPLTDEQIGIIYNLHLRNGGRIQRFARAIEAAHGIKEKNT